MNKYILWFKLLSLSNKIAILGVLVTIIIGILTFYPHDSGEVIHQEAKNTGSSQQVIGDGNSITNNGD